MIIGLGIDIVELDRIAHSWERFQERFARKILHPEEMAALPERPVAFLASRFAAKEAAVKALGTGFAEGVIPTDIQVAKDASGKPELLLHGRAAERFAAMGGTRAHLSFSHEKHAATAVVVLEA